MASAQFLGLRDGRGGAGNLLHNRNGVAVEALSLMGQDGLFPDPVKEVDPQLVFQLLDLDRYGGLGIAKGLGGSGKAFSLGHLDKGADFPKFHVILL